MTVADYVFVGDREDGGNGLYSIEVTDKQNPSVAGTVSSIRQPNKIARIGDYLVVTEKSDRCVVVVDASDPANPSEVGRTDEVLSVAQYGVVVGPNGDYAYTAARSGQVAIIDISTRSDPTLVSKAIDSTVMDGATWLDYANGHVFVTCGGYNGGTAQDANRRVVSVDVSDKQNPVIVDELQDDKLVRADGIRIYKEHAYVGVWDEGYFHAIDISDPSALEFTDSLQNPAYNRIFQITIRKQEELAFCSAEGVEGIVVFDISDPTNLIEEGRITLTNGKDMHGVVVDDKYLYAVAATDEAFTVVEWGG